jgi:hypothetical protein
MAAFVVNELQYAKIGRDAAAFLAVEADRQRRAQEVVENRLDISS